MLAEAVGVHACVYAGYGAEEGGVGGRKKQTRNPSFYILVNSPVFACNPPVTKRKISWCESFQRISSLSSRDIALRVNKKDTQILHQVPENALRTLSWTVKEATLLLSGES